MFYTITKPVGLLPVWELLRTIIGGIVLFWLVMFINRRIIRDDSQPRLVHVIDVHSTSNYFSSVSLEDESSNVDISAFTAVRVPKKKKLSRSYKQTKVNNNN